jgi:hypothetical protein
MQERHEFVVHKHDSTVLWVNYVYGQLMPPAGTIQNLVYIGLHNTHTKRRS